MREILFRGKKENGKWCYGSLITADWYSNETTYILQLGQQCQVAEKTIGQYTGLTDKNGNKIFEGDIIKTQPFYDRPYSDKRKSKEFIGVVKYKTKIFNGNKYYSKQCYHGEWGLKFYEDFGKYTHYSWGELWNCEVIGNIHDNPELLKEAEK